MSWAETGYSETPHTPFPAATRANLYAIDGMGYPPRRAELSINAGLTECCSAYHHKAAFSEIFTGEIDSNRWAAFVAMDELLGGQALCGGKQNSH